jgi:hypothetical protein
VKGQLHTRFAKASSTELQILGDTGTMILGNDGKDAFVDFGSFGPLIDPVQPNGE